MKQMKIWIVALTMIMGISLTSCVNSSDNGPYPGTDIVEVFTGYGTSFRNASGFIYYPTSSSLAAVETTYKFNTSSSKVAYILYYEIEEETPTSGTKTTMNIDLQYAASLDTTVELPEEEGASNDSVATAAIIGLQTAMSQNEKIHIINDKYLICGINYYAYKIDNHSFTMVYYEEETTADSDGITLYLRHRDNEDTYANYNATLNLAGSYPVYYWKSFDLSRVFQDYKRKTNNSSVKIKIVTEENSSSEKLENATEKVYEATYEFKTK